MFELIKFLTIERLKDKMLQCENLDQDVKEAFKGQLDRLRARYQEHKFIKEFLDISY
ncbi:hypothetical protein JIY74_27565 [Vibrio harveyi]|nr:hypothetical protein [Vibrio harveyi]